ncbi:MAG: prepilin-type N-terminal cleavage/methylation domain-containing protein [Alphaproteobacteria bacterium]|nr:prepilin-type N-terminal cleavage/methylation domain-containing protein [Alphaproteobacteria bacterium]
MHKTSSIKIKNGFSLLELSIVLTIIGLLVGGILVGRALIRASEVRSVVSDVNRLKTEISTFRLKYGTLPGDAINASTYLGGSAVNGNNNSQIDYLLGLPGEEYYAWQHLALAKMTAGDYDGSTTNLPKSRISNGFYRISYQTNVYGKSGNMISFNALNQTFSLAHDPILNPADAHSIDGKLDDGLADKGRVLAFNPEGVPGCVTNDYTAGSGDYILTNNSVLCKMFFILEY